MTQLTYCQKCGGAWRPFRLEHPEHPGICVPCQNYLDLGSPPVWMRRGGAGRFGPAAQTRVLANMGHNPSLMGPAALGVALRGMESLIGEALAQTDAAVNDGPIDPTMTYEEDDDLDLDH
jgi:hypothetical protein